MTAPVIRDGQCGRPTKKGTPCAQHALSWWWLLGGMFDMSRKDGYPKACYNHLTEDERAMYDKSKAAYGELARVAEERFRQAEPACWSWPVPQDLEPWEPEIPSVGDGNDAIGELTAAYLRRSCEDPEDRAAALLNHWQDGRCAVCGANQPGLVEDHDHETDLVRGWLCQSCNIREGLDRFGEGPFSRYRERHPTSILGLRIRYWNHFTDEHAEPAPR